MESGNIKIGLKTFNLCINSGQDEWYSPESHIPKAKEELNKGISLINTRQKIIKLADKSEFGWATVQGYVRSKKLRREPLLRLKHFKRKREKLAPKFPRLLCLHPSALPDLLAVLFALFLQLLVIFAPRVDAPTIHSELLICVFDAASEVTGPISVIPEINLCRQDPSLQCRRTLASERILINRTPSWIQTRKRLGEDENAS